MRPDAADNAVLREISTLLSNQRLILRETQRAVTPVGGVAVFVTFLHKLGFAEKLRQRMQNQLESLLEKAHIKLSGFVTDLLGVSSRRMLQALAERETDPAAVGRPRG